MKKRICAAALLLIFAAALCSCNSLNIIELNDRLIIQAIGIDKTSDGYEVSIQGLDTEMHGGGSENGKTGSITKNFLFSGKNISEALAEIHSKTGLSPLYSQARIIIMGMSAAEENIGDALDFFLREYTTRSDIFIVVAENSAKELVCASFGENVVGATVMEEAVKSGKYTGRAVAVPLYKFVNFMLSDTDAAYCSVIKAADGILSENKEIEICGTAIFKDTKLRCILNSEQTQGLLFLTDKIEETKISVNTDAGNFGLQIVESRTKIKTRFNGRPEYSFEVKAVCDIIEYKNSSFNQISAQQTHDVAAAAAKKINEIMSDALSYAFYSNSSDICRFGKRLWFNAPQEYRKLKEPSDFSALSVMSEITVNAQIRKIGKEILQFEKS